jgi:hypothetical protein
MQVFLTENLRQYFCLRHTPTLVLLSSADKYAALMGKVHKMGVWIAENPRGSRMAARPTAEFRVAALDRGVSV